LAAVCELTYLQAVLLGLLQGITEFLPVSSSGHLVLLEHLMGLETGSPEMLFFDVVVHVATLIAIAAVFRRPFGKFVRAVLEDLRGIFLRRDAGPVAGDAAGQTSAAGRAPMVALRIAGLATVAFVVTGAVALPLEGWFKRAFERLDVVGLAWLVTALLLFSTRWVRRPRTGWKRYGFGSAALVGLAQAIAVTPGISRSGSTICAAWLTGLRRRWSAQFSFLIAAPAILGAAAKAFHETMQTTAGVVISGPILVGFVVAALSGYVALKVLVIFVERARLWWFGFYCLALGLAVLSARWFA